jgi:hypothetical protein
MARMADLDNLARQLGGTPDALFYGATLLT